MDLFTDYEWDKHKYWSLKGHNPRPEQKKIIDDIVTAIDNGYKNIILEAGTGIGKSAIATTIANMNDDTYILTRTKQLQEQYLKDFGYMLAEIKGRSNYICNTSSTSDFTFMCDTCVSDKPCKNCNYNNARHYAMYAPTVLANYDYLYYGSLYTDKWPQRDLLILDEAHKFESFIMNKVTRTLSDDYCKNNYGIDIFSSIRNGDNLNNWKSPAAWVDVLQSITDKIPELMIDIKNELFALKSKRQTRSVQIQKQKLTRKLNDLEKKQISFENLIKELDNDKTEWVVLLPTKGQILSTKFDSKVEFKPITVQQYTNDILKLGDTRLFLTATIGDENKFCEWINIDPSETFTIYQKSNFPVENRPIYKHYVCNMSGSTDRVPNWKTNEGLQAILDICMEYPEQKGIIHTTSHAQTYWILQNLSQYLPLWKIEADRKSNWNNLTREEVVKRFIHTDMPAILVGAGIKDGVDLKDDACRFQILYKTPYPAFDSQVRKRNVKDKVWWNYQAVMDSMQAYGRGVRSETDYCDFWILDSKFEQLLTKWEYLFNDYFLEAIQ